MKKQIQKSIVSSAKTINNVSKLIPVIEKSVNLIVNSLQNGNKIVLFGNGGSAADAQHIAAELIGRFCKERQSYPAIALTTDTSIITALGNDYSFETIFSRQCESLISSGDVVIGISTSGNSKNIQKGLIASKKNGAITIGLLGNKGGSIKNFVDIPIIVSSSSTPRIQEAHRVIYHIICENIENLMDK
jgi:D-sedoheptulose 7-phosphate isomerase